MHSNKVDKSSQMLTYSDAGVDIDAGNKTVELMKEAVEQTHSDAVLNGLGGFGGLFSLQAFQDMEEPILVSGTDGVGTKLRLAIMMNRHETIGQDCVAMSVNDILVQGAKPLFFLDYIATGKVDPEGIATIVKGVAEACAESECALLGGETAEMAGFYADDDYDLAGFAVGIVDKKKIIDGRSISSGDVLIGLPSSGIHSNGYSLVRRILLEEQKIDLQTYREDLGCTIGEEVLKPTRLYVKALAPLFGTSYIKGLVHITGGGFYDNIPRILPEKVSVEIDKDAWPVPRIFQLLQEWGPVADREMYRTFNMGIGMVLFVGAEHVDEVLEDLARRGEKAHIIGRVVEDTTEGRDGQEKDVAQSDSREKSKVVIKGIA